LIIGEKMGVKSGQKALIFVHFCKFLHKKRAFLLISGHFLLVFYPIFLAYFTQTLQANMPASIFRLKNNDWSPNCPKIICQKPNFFKNLPQKILQK